MIDDHPHSAEFYVNGKVERKDLMEYLNDRDVAVSRMSAYTMKIRTSVLNKFWSDHTSDKYGLRCDMSPCVRRPFAAVP